MNQQKTVLSKWQMKVFGILLLIINVIIYLFIIFYSVYSWVNYIRIDKMLVRGDYKYISLLEYFVENFRFSGLFSVLFITSSFFIVCAIILLYGSHYSDSLNHDET